MADLEFEKLLNDVIENPNSIIEGDFDFETMKKLKEEISKGLILPQDANQPTRAAAFNFHNMRESYYQKFSMTTLIAFIFQCNFEHQIPLEKRLWKSELVDDEKPIELDEIITFLEKTLEVTKIAKKAKDAHHKMQIDELEMKGKPSDKFINEMKELKDRECAMTYTAANMTYKWGESIKPRMHPSYEHFAEQSQDVREAIMSFPKPIKSTDIEIPENFAKGLITDFLDKYLGFDFTTHVRKASLKVKGAAIKEQLKEQQKLAKIATKVADPLVQRVLDDARAANVVRSILDDEVISEIAVAAAGEPKRFDEFARRGQMAGTASGASTGLKKNNTNFALEVIPSADIFKRIQTYQDVNFDTLKNITDIIYDERCMFDISLAIWDVFTGKDQKDVDEQFKAFCNKHEGSQYEFMSINLGSNRVISSTKENRFKMDVFNNDSHLLKKICDQMDNDKKIGMPMMEKRVQNEKGNNIKNDGPDAVGLGAYQQTLGHKGIAASGVKRVIDKETMLRLEAENGNTKAKQELEVLDQTSEKMETIMNKETLTMEDKANLRHLKDDYRRAREMLEVPNNAVQVDCFINDGGSIQKKSIYTEADDKGEVEEKARIINERRSKVGI